MYCVELRRLLSSKMIWLTSLLCLLSPIIGYFFKFSDDRIMSGHYIANPISTGTSIGAILWAVITILEADRLHRSNVDILTDSISSVHTLSTAKVLSLLTIATLITIICSIIYLPFTALKMDYLFSAEFYFANFFAFMLPTWWISILFADAFYQITRRVELSVLIYMSVAFWSLSGLIWNNYFVCWLSPRIITYSDGFSSLWPLRIGLYTRILWLFIAIGIWSFSMLCIRKYQQNFIHSLLGNMKKFSIFFLSLLFIFAGISLWHFQPFIDHGPDEQVLNTKPENTQISMSPHQVTNVHYTIDTDPFTGRISGKAEYFISSPYDGTSSITLNCGYKIKKITYDGKNISFQTLNDDFEGYRTTCFELPTEYNKTLLIEYAGFPTLTKAYSSYMVSTSVDFDYITLSTRAITPMLDNHYTYHSYSTLDITIPSHLTPFLNFKQMTNYIDNNNGTKTWNSTSTPYIIDFTAGSYVVDTISIDNFNIDFAYGKAYQSVVEKYNAKQSVIDVFTYCGSHYGALPFIKDENLLLQQRSSMLLGGYATSGFSTWFETVLSPDTLNDQNKGANSTEVFIHEMIHQWWGGLGLNCTEEDIWSCEGLTVYSTYRIVKEIYGELYAKQYYINAWQEAVDRQNRSFYNRHPEYIKQLPDSYQVLIKHKNNSTNKYCRMPLMILKAEKLVGGEEKMDAILQKMYTDKNNFEQNYFSYQDFLDYCKLKKEDLYLE